MKAKATQVYRDRLKWINMLGRSVEEQKDSHPRAMCVEPEARKVRFTQPPSIACMQRFETYNKLLKGEKKNLGKKTSGVLRINSYLLLFAPKAANYEMEDCPWKVRVLPSNQDTHRTGFTYKYIYRASGS